MEDERLDLSALDPMRDPARWRGVFETTLARVGAVLAERERRQDPLVLIAAWTRPLLAVAAVAVLLLVPVEIALERVEARAEQVRGLAALSEDWARGERQPSGAELRRVLAPGNGR